MDIDIILDPACTPAQATEIAVEAERLGVRGVWSSNYHQDWDAYLVLAPAAAATSRILLGPLAVSPWEQHPLKMANSLLTLNELSNGRAMIAISGGGGVLGAIGWKASADGPAWPGRHPVKGTRYPDHRVRGVRECLDVLELARAGKLAMGYPGRVFAINRPFQMKYAKSKRGPLLYSCSSGPQMIRMGTHQADGIQVSDYTVDMLAHAAPAIQAGLAERAEPAKDFRVGNFWAWHMKQDREASMWEARKELIWRGAIIGQVEEELLPFCHGEDEVRLIIDKLQNFMKAYWTGSGQIDGVPEDLVNRLISGMASAGGLDEIDREVERYRGFARHGLTELALRLHEQPMEGLRLIGERVLPALR